MQLKVRRSYVFVEDRQVEAGKVADVPLRRAAAVTVLENPYVAGYIENLKPAIEASARLGAEMAQALLKAFGQYEIQSYGKGGLVGTSGEQEHANAMLTTVFANPIRDAIGGGEAWISSFTKVCASGASIDIPMNHIDDVYVRSHYDGMTLAIPGTPAPDEVALIFCIANRGRLNARVGGLTHEEVKARRAKQ
jgi:hypothetical protein